MLCLVSPRFAAQGLAYIPLKSGLFRTALPEFKALEEFEWIGYPELQAEMVQVLLKSHPHLVKLGLMYLSNSYRLM
jgi:hypothetical protein